MNKNKNLLVLGILIVIVGAFYFITKKAMAPVVVLPNPSLSTSRSQVYENQYMKVTIPDGWTAKQANRTVYNGTCVNKQNCVMIPKV